MRCAALQENAEVIRVRNFKTDIDTVRSRMLHFLGWLAVYHSDHGSYHYHNLITIYLFFGRVRPGGLHLSVI